ncbi:Complex I intermediate-associated protein 30 (CIA30) [Roseovarius sp. THAF9]|uniref:CIA30 family protein n=1 Tax=Roseovarius sp. THAF9 TaxID=2587847 RepID=UPI0012A8A70A|nr:CIA30 family protein [Roseovarius sp. THAF9]QFT94040.1 Complex I intermediate-associated protein 30 (CIA30) [Roseovarius sp. THAF9]
MRLPLNEPGRWTYVGDTVMGGVSEGAARVETQSGQPVLRLTGQVSTANNGGFIQTRTKLDTAPSADAYGVVIEARGNDQRYFVHLRTTGTSLPWQYYQAAFDVTSDWREYRLPFEAFKPSGNLLRAVPDADSIRSVGIVAFGRNHQADISVRLVGFY